MNLQITAITDRGGVRKNNEDRILVGTEILVEGRGDFFIFLEEKSKYVCAVADGMGGHQAGEIAAQIALESLRQHVQSLELNLTLEELEKSFRIWADKTHIKLLVEGEKDINLHGMGTTLVALIFYEGGIYFINAGDSRLYRFRDRILARLSEDHSLKAVTGVESHVILNSLGGGKTSFIDFGFATKRLIEGDVFLLCSDGLTDLLSDEEMEMYLSSNSEATELITMARQRGATDNISLVLVRVVSNPVS